MTDNNTFRPDNKRRLGKTGSIITNRWWSTINNPHLRKETEMTLNRTLKVTVLLFGTLPMVLGSSIASAQQLDPTSGRIQARKAQKLAQYHECAEFALRVYQGARSQANGDVKKIRAAERHYHGNLSRCRARFL